MTEDDQRPLPTCKTCHEPFKPANRWQSFCSEKCRNTFHNAKKLKEEIIKCPHCGTTSDMPNLIELEWTSSNVYKYFCNFCSKTFQLKDTSS